MIPWQENSDFYNAAAKVACRVGGQSPEGSTDVERATFWESLLDCHSTIGAIDFTPGAGYLPRPA